MAWQCACGASWSSGVSCLTCGRWAPWYEAPPEPPPLPPRRGLTPLGDALAGLIALVLLAGFVAIDVKQRRRTDAVEREFRAAVAELSEFVARERGKPFLRPVDAELLDDGEFEEMLGDSGGFGGLGDTMYALRLADPQDDLDAAGSRTVDVVGFYDDAEDAMFVRGVEVTPYVRLVLVHELVHAWQDQYFDLESVGDDAATLDEQIAVEAVVEGDATRVEEAWLAAQSAADRAEIEREEVGDPLRREPDRGERSLGLLYSFPYSAGLEFTAALHADGGNAAVDAAFLRPPESTEHVLHPERYERDERPRVVDDPQPASEPVDSGTLGELGLVLVLSRGDLTDEALAAAEGWGGDTYVTWDDGDLLCTLVHVVMDTRAARNRLVTALRALDGTLWVVTRTGRAGVTLRSCVPSRA